MAEQAQAAGPSVTPQPGPQAAFIKCPVSEIFYGGARGGGKTFAALLKFVFHARKYGKDASGIFFRRQLPQLEAAIDEAKGLYFPLGCEWKEQAKTFVFPNGAKLKFRPLERDSDAEKYQGHQYTYIAFEELTNYPDPRPVDKLRATMRSAAGVPCQLVATGNPGGPGHQWVKARYIDPAPDGFEILRDEQGQERVFIPAKVRDNLILLQNDPSYVSRLRQAGSKELVKAWLDGDWSVIEGAFFDEFSTEQHVLAPFPIPVEWAKFRSMDWGSAAPSSIGWWAVVQDDYEVPVGDTTRILPRGALVRYREWYTATAPNKGMKLTAEEVAAGIHERTRSDEKIAYSVLDPAAFANDGGPSIAERMAAKGVWFKRADNKRVGTAGAMGGWDQLRARLRGENGVPMIYFFSTCRDTIRTLPALQHDEAKPEDVDTEQEDHAADEVRYACMSRPYRRQDKKKPDDPFRLPTMKEIFEEAGVSRA